MILSMILKERIFTFIVNFGLIVIRNFFSVVPILGGIYELL